MSASERPVTPISLFYSYSHKDAALRKRLEAHLTLLKDEGIIRDWDDRRIAAGTEWDGVISENLDQAGIILLLVSADFLASRYCRDVEIARAMERHEAGTARVIPVILRPVYWHTAPFGKLQALPKTVSRWPRGLTATRPSQTSLRVSARLRLICWPGPRTPWLQQGVRTRRPAPGLRPANSGRGQARSTNLTRPVDKQRPLPQLQKR